MSDRNDKGHFAPGNEVQKLGHEPRRQGLNKPYTDAIRQLLQTPQDQAHPGSWGERKTWTHAQELAERHLVMALKGDLDTARLIINRAEGKEPMAPEDRAVQENLGQFLLGGLPALQALQIALGLRKPKEIEVTTVVPDEPR